MIIIYRTLNSYYGYDIQFFFLISQLKGSMIEKQSSFVDILRGK